MTENERKFYIGLEKLTRETGVIISGCGCCASPYLEEIKRPIDERAGYAWGFSDVQWIDPNDEYNWREYKDNLVKDDVDE